MHKEARAETRVSPLNMRGDEFRVIGHRLIDAEKLRNTFAYHPPYYNFGVEAINYLDLGPQNSCGFRALKVWLAIQQVGREGYIRMISDDIRLSRKLFEEVSHHDDLEALTQPLSIATFRYVPHDLKSGGKDVEIYLNQLNREILARIESGGEAFASNAVIDGKFALRACIVNSQTNASHIEALPRLVVRLGRAADAELRPRTAQ